MGVVKLLEQKKVIQAFGACLLVSPAFNTLMTMSLLADSDKKWTLAMFWKILAYESLAIKFLYVCGIIISLVMLSGSRSAWKFVLILLGGHILHQVTNLGQSLRTNYASGLFFVVNVAVFLFIADQLVWKQKRMDRASSKPQSDPNLPQASSEPSPMAAVSTPSLPPTPAPAAQVIPAASAPIQSAAKRVMVHFQGFGPWAKLMSISRKGIHVRSLSQPPFEIGSREIEVQMKNGLTLRTRLSHQTDQDFYFEYTNLTPEDVQKLNQWLKQQAA